MFYLPIEHFQEFVDNGVLEPYADQVGVDVYPALQETFTADGTYYCVPKDFSTLALEVNTAALDEAGLQPPTTWAELEAAAEATTSGDRVGLVIGPELARVMVFMLQAGGPNGLLNRLIALFGLDGPAWLDDARGVGHIALGWLGIDSPPNFLGDHEFMGLSWWD